MNESETCRIAIDIGGTFTDLVLDREGEGQRLAKVPSTPPDYSRGVVDALSRVLEDFREMSILVHGTTAQLNAFLERKGARTALLTTRGFGDVYAMGRGSRDRMYDLHYR
ncbi:MAG: hydantoinase/oxoprolinase N-terminal domain-containing protein, partial [Vicinamibacteria bacterium]